MGSFCGVDSRNSGSGGAEAGGAGAANCSFDGVAGSLSALVAVVGGASPIGTSISSLLRLDESPRGGDERRCARLVGGAVAVVRVAFCRSAIQPKRGESIQMRKLNSYSQN